MNRRSMVTISVAAVLAVLALPALQDGSVASAEVLNRIVATVGSEVILQDEVVASIQPLLSDLRAHVSSQDEFDRQARELFNEALQQSIDNKLLLREALLAGLQVEDALVEERLKENEEYVQERLATGYTMGDLRDHLRKQILAWRMARAKQATFEREVVVSEAEVREYYQQHRSDFQQPEQLRIRQVFLIAEDDAARTRAWEQLQAIEEKLAGGAQFAQLAQSHSDGPAADDGGLIGWVARGDLRPALEQAAFDTPVGGRSEIVETQYGLHLLSVDERKEAGLMELDEARVIIEPALRAEKAMEKYDNWLRELRKRSRVRVL